MAMVNQVVNTPMFNPNVKDSRWLTLEVCREYTRNKCTRTENECKFAHPPAHVEVQNGRVTCCFDSIKGKCQRKDPPCKYLHPPQHLKEQLLQNGRNNLILKNLQMQALTASLQPVMPSIYSPVLDGYHPEGHSYPKAYVNMYYEKAPPPYLVQNPTAAFSPYSVMSPTLPGVPNMMQTVDTTSGAGGVPVSAAQVTSVMPNAAPMAQQKLPRADRLEPSTSLSSNGSDPSMWAGSQAESVLSSSHTYSPVYLQPQMVEVLTTGPGKKRPRDPADDFVLSVPGVATQPVMKRAAVADSKSGVPMYHPSTGSAAAYQTALAAMQLQQQPFVPVTMSLPTTVPTASTVAATTYASNAASVSCYDDESHQFQDTLPLCRDFKSGRCRRPQCKYIHLVEDYVEVSDGKVKVCRDALKGKCSRPTCKYYHIPALSLLM